MQSWYDTGNENNDNGDFYICGDGRRKTAEHGADA